MESVSALGSPVVVFPHSSLETGLMLQCVTTSNVDIDMKPDFGLQPSASGEDLTPPDTLSAPTPELPHAREDDAEMADVTPPQSQSVGMSQSAEHPFEYVSYTHLPSKARHRSRSRSVRYTPYDNEAAQTQAVPASAPAATTQPSKQSKMTGRPQMSYAELITDAICESETG